MARLVTCGFETRQLSATTSASEGEGFADGNFATLPCVVETGTVRSGSASIKCNTDTSTNTQFVRWNFTGALDVSYFARGAFYVTANPTASQAVLVLVGGANVIGQLRINTDGTVTLQARKAGVLTTIGTTTSAVTLNAWTLFELQVKVTTAGTTGTMSARINTTLVPISVGEGGGTQWTGDLGTTALSVLRAGKTGPSNQGGSALYIDDVALNDDQGASQNSWPGNGKIVLLQPISDNARVGFTAGAGATTSLFDAVNNTPPVGVVLASATNTSQIKDGTNNATDTYDANLQTYTTGGLTASSTIALVQAVAQGGNSTITARTLGVKQLSNPGPGTEGTVSSGTTLAATTPAGWTTFRDTITYAPSPTLGSSPVVRVRKGTASTDSMMYDLMGLYVEYTTTNTATPTASMVTSPVLVRDGSKIVSASEAFTPTIVRADSKTLSVAAQFTASSPKTVTAPKAASVTHTATAVRQPGLVKSAAQSFTASIKRDVTVTLAVAALFVATRIGSARRTLTTATQAFTATVTSALSFRRELSITQGFSAAVTTMVTYLAHINPLTTARRVGALQPDDSKNVGNLPSKD